LAAEKTNKANDDAKSKDKSKDKEKGKGKGKAIAGSAGAAERKDKDITRTTAAAAEDTESDLVDDILSMDETLTHFSQVFWLRDFGMPVYRWAGNDTEWTEFVLQLRSEVVPLIESKIVSMQNSSGCEMSIEEEQLNGESTKLLRFVRGSSNTPANEAMTRALVEVSRLMGTGLHAGPDYPTSSKSNRSRGPAVGVTGTVPFPSSSSLPPESALVPASAAAAAASAAAGAAATAAPEATAEATTAEAATAMDEDDIKPESDKILVRCHQDCLVLEEKARQELYVAVERERHVRAQRDAGLDCAATTVQRKASVSAAIADADAETLRLEQLLYEARTRAADLRKSESSIDESIKQMELTNARLGIALSSAQESLTLHWEKLRLAVSDSEEQRTNLPSR
jgi:hypothetical protein